MKIPLQTMQKKYKIAAICYPRKEYSVFWKEENIIVDRHKPSASFLVESSLVFLAMLIFSWGLQAKLALYRADDGAICATNSMAKLAVENRSDLATVQIRDQGIPPAVPEIHHLAAFASSSHLLQASTAKLAELELRLSEPGQYFLHGPDLKRRPPPAFC